MSEPQPSENFWDWRESLRAAFGAAGDNDGAAAGMAENEAPYAITQGPAPVDERLVQAIWAQQLIQPGGLRTAGGAPLRVLDPGRWNRGAGADFKDAALMIGADAMRGDIEIHVRASDWLNHAHQRDLDYNSVILHIVLTIDDARIDDPLHNGKAVPRLELEPYIFPDIETLRRSLSPDDFVYAQPASAGLCYPLMRDMPAGAVADFLDRAGDERLVAKTQRLDEQTRAPGGSGTTGTTAAAGDSVLEQTFYQALMMSLGSGAGKTLYYLLAKRTPLTEMMDYVRELPMEHRALGFEALLLHVGGLAGESLATVDAPPEARARLDALAEIWRSFEAYWCDRVIPPTRRWFQGIRPVNFPVRRLAGVAALLARAQCTGRMPLADLVGHIHAGRATLEGAVLTRRKRHPLIKDLMEWFCVSGENTFWGTHYSFTARPAARSMDLIGEATALSLVLNALLPAALLRARRSGDTALGEAVHRLYGLFPPLQPNHITEFMSRRLFGDAAAADAIITTERRRQGLFQVFYHCCNAEERHCESCYYRQS